MKKFAKILCVCFVMVFILSSTSTVFAAGESFEFTSSNFLYGFWSNKSVPQKNDLRLYTELSTCYYQVGNVKYYGWHSVSATIGQTMTSASRFANTDVSQGDWTDFILDKRSSVIQIHTRIDAPRIGGYASYGKSNYSAGYSKLFAN